MLGTQQLGQLDQADVLPRCHGRQDHRAERLDAVRACVPALRLGLDTACRVDGLNPADGTYTNGT